MDLQHEELARLEYREREQYLFREAEIERLLREDAPGGGASSNQVLAGLGAQIVSLGCWLQRRAGVSNTAGTH